MDASAGRPRQASGARFAFPSPTIYALAQALCGRDPFFRAGQRLPSRVPFRSLP